MYRLEGAQCECAERDYRCEERVEYRERFEPFFVFVFRFFVFLRKIKNKIFTYRIEKILEYATEEKAATMYVLLEEKDQ